MPRKHRESEPFSDVQLHFYHWILTQLGEEIMRTAASLADSSSTKDEIEQRFWDKVERTLTDPDSTAEFRRWSLEFSDEKKSDPEYRGRMWNYLLKVINNAKNDNFRVRLSVNDNVKVDDISLEVRGGIAPIIPTKFELSSTLNKLRSVLYLHKSYAKGSEFFDSDLSIVMMSRLDGLSFPEIAKELGDEWTVNRAAGAVRRFDKFVENVLKNDNPPSH